MSLVEIGKMELSDMGANFLGAKKLEKSEVLNMGRGKDTRQE